MTNDSVAKILRERRQLELQKRDLRARLDKLPFSECLCPACATEERIRTELAMDDETLIKTALPKRA